MIINQPKILEILNNTIHKKNLQEIKVNIENIKQNLTTFKNDNIGLLNISSNGETIQIEKDYLEKELQQILETQTLERTKYYVNRLIKSLIEVKTSKINELNLNRWKEYNDIITDSLWIFDKRDNSGVHTAGYWGNFVPQIPNQFIKRYTKKNDWVLDTFLGCGTTLIECQRLGRNGIGIELQSDIAKQAFKTIEKEKNLFSHNINEKVKVGDSTEIDYEVLLNEIGIKTVQLLIMHPPYWDIIKFSDNKKDLSNCKSIDEFLVLMSKIINKTYKILEKGRYLVLVIGDKYSKGEWIPLGFYTMQKALEAGYSLKSIIVKNFDETLSKRNQKELWRYRALVGGFYIFKHEYIFLLKK